MNKFLLGFTGYIIIGIDQKCKLENV